MWGSVTTCLQRLKLQWYRRRIERALALTDRGEVRSDGLRLTRICNRLEMEWRARDIHPWDLDLPLERRARAFVEQSLADTEAAICRLFVTFPQVDVIDITVLEPASRNTIIAGTVHRSDLKDDQRLLSVKMRLRELGLRYSDCDDHYLNYSTVQDGSG